MDMIYKQVLGFETPERCFNLTVNVGMCIGPTRSSASGLPL